MATTNTTYRYPLDKTGTSTDNLVQDEIHTLPDRVYRAFAPYYGAYYTESMVVTDVDTGLVLTSSQYVNTELLEFPTGAYGKEICGIVLITDPNVSTNVKVTYQALGGDYSMNADAIVNMLNNLLLDDRPISWGDILNKPDSFTPAAHYHDIGDVYGFEYLVHAVERVREAILIGDDVAHDQIYNYIDTRVTELTNDYTETNTALTAHTNNLLNPHGTTKAQIGLTNVLDYGVATDEEATNGLVDDKYMTPRKSLLLINSTVVSQLNAHIADKANPHDTTKAQVGLDSVLNYGLATTTEAQAGTSNTAYMTPLLTAYAIGTQALAPLTAHTTNTSNPHAVTQSQVGLSNVENYKQVRNSGNNVIWMAWNTTAGELQLTVDSTYMGRVHTTQQPDPNIAANYNTLSTSITNLNTSLTSSISTTNTNLTSHTTSTSNPHSTTAAQVGLGSVLNQKQVINSGGNAIYMIWTSGEIQLTVDSTSMGRVHTTSQPDPNIAVVSTALSTHAANTSNPHSTTAAQVGLGSVLNQKQVINSGSHAIYMDWASPYLTCTVDSTDIGHVITSINCLATTAQAQAGTDDVQYMTPLKVSQAITQLATKKYSITPIAVNTYVDGNSNSQQISYVSIYDASNNWLRQMGVGPDMSDDTVIYLTWSYYYAAIYNIQVTPIGRNIQSVSLTDSSGLIERYIAPFKRSVSTRGMAVASLRLQGSDTDRAAWSWLVEGTAQLTSGNLVGPGVTTYNTSYNRTNFDNTSEVDTGTGWSNGGLNGYTGTYPS